MTLTYDHAKHANEPAYKALQAAVTAFLNEPGFNADYDERKVIINELGSGLVYGDTCRQCTANGDHDSRFPVQVIEKSPDSVACIYHCHVCGDVYKVAHYSPMGRPEREAEDQD